jgi:hypothetical protein
MGDGLASAFQDVDRAGNLALLSGCLSLVESIPFFVERKRESYSLLGAAPVRRILDFRCDLGDDPAAMAADGDGRVFSSCTGFLVRGTRLEGAGREG